MVARTKQIPDSTAQSFSEDFCLHKSSVISILWETLHCKKKKVASTPDVRLIPERKLWLRKDVRILLPKNREAHKRMFTLRPSGGVRTNQVYKVSVRDSEFWKKDKWDNYKTNTAKLNQYIMWEISLYHSCEMFCSYLREEAQLVFLLSLSATTGHASNCFSALFSTVWLSKITVIVMRSHNHTSFFL